MPTFPLLFDLAIEPLLSHLASSPAIQGILVESMELKLALFADGVYFFLEHPLRDIPIILERLNSFSLCSGFKVNASKSELLVLAKESDYSPSCFAALPVTVACKSVKYLEILIEKTPQSLYNLNYPPLISKIVKDLKKWSHLPLSFLPRCHLLKMLCFPK